jgi:hypothetical protein
MKEITDLHKIANMVRVASISSTTVNFNALGPAFVSNGNDVNKMEDGVRPE